MMFRSFVWLSFVLIFAVLCSAHVIDILPNCVVNVDQVTEVVVREEVEAIVFNRRQLHDRTNVKYGQHLKLICDLSVSSPFTVAWRISTKELQEPRIDGKELDIPAVEYALHGEYIHCEVALLSNTSAPKDAIGTNLVIVDLAPPLINMTKTIAVMENETLTITCKVIAGTPKPAISWKFKGFDDTIFRDLPATGEELTINMTGMGNAGQYSCTAANPVKRVTKLTEMAVQKLPTAVIEDVSRMTVAYGTSFTLTCRVNGFPLPRIFWTDGKGKKLFSKVEIVNFYEKVSVLKLKGLKRSQEYSCHAVNTLGNVKESIGVTVLSPFVVHKHPDNFTKVHYGKTTTIICNITSSLPITIKWYKNSNMSEIQSDKTYDISAGNTALNIVNMDMDSIGNYSCIASLLSDERENVSFTSDVQVDDLAPPQTSNSNKIVVMEKTWVTLYCKIAGGVPPPKLSWFAKRHGDTSYSELETTTEELDLPNIAIAEAGVYQCVVKNGIGETNMTTDVQVRKVPVTSIDEGPSASVLFGSNVSITCTIVALPLPTVQWKDDDGAFILQSTNGSSILHELTTVNHYIIVSKITVPKMKGDRRFSCMGANVLGFHESGIDVNVRPAFVVHQTPDSTTNVHYITSRDLVCNITSELPMRMKWFHNSSELHTSDKFTISPNETVLTIKSMVGLDLEGSYMCKASLVSDENEKVVFSTNVRIDDLAPPLINMTKNIAVLENETLTITCKVIAGTPKPAISWKFKGFDDTIFRDIPATGEELTISMTSMGNAGQYSCTAANLLANGRVTKVTDVQVRKVPVTSIDEGPSASVLFGSNVSITCTIVAFPLPSVQWKDDDGAIILQSTNGSSILHELTTVNHYIIVSKITVPKMKGDRRFSCMGANVLGFHESGIDVNVRPAFVVHQTPDSTTNVHYITSRDLVCNITSELPMRMKWFHNSSELHTSDKFTISPNETVLTIKSMVGLDLEGSYMCKASLVSDENEKVVFSTNVRIDDLAPPLINMTKNIAVLENETLTITCKVIAGTPKPAISWKFKGFDDTIFRDIPATGEELTISMTSMGNAGQYSCTAANLLANGRVTKVTDVQVRKVPVTSIDEGPSASVLFGSNVSITCTIVAFPLPSVQWKDDDGAIILQSTNGSSILHELTTVNHYMIVSKITVPGMKGDRRFSCMGANVLGFHESGIDVNVRPAFVVHQTPDSTTNVHYIASRELVCNVTSELPMRMKWFHNSSELHTSDKFTISPNETVLTIKSMVGLDLEGSYMCKASLVSDENEKVVFSTNVRIDDLAPPLINMTKNIAVLENETLTITCKVIAGTPKPAISWKFKGFDDTIFRDLPATGEELTISMTGMGNAGQYSCTAANLLANGRVTKVTDVQVRKVPVTSIDEGPSASVLFGSNVSITCTIVAFPLPSVQWKDDDGAIILQSTNGSSILHELTTLNHYMIVSKITVPGMKGDRRFSCMGANVLGFHESGIDVNVRPAFVVHQTPDITTNVHYIASRDLVCNITSELPMRMKWFHNSSELHTSDKFTISPNETVLTIKSMVGLDLEGSYMCKASLVSDENEKVVFSTNVRIDDLVPAKITSFTGFGTTVTVINLEELSLACKATGYPKPVISWKYNPSSSSYPTTLGKGESIATTNIGYDNAGTYVCTASNISGEDSRSISVVVS